MHVGTTMGIPGCRGFSSFPDAKSRPEFGRTGVYLLLGLSVFEVPRVEKSGGIKLLLRGKGILAHGRDMDSPSTAAGVLLGRSANGRTEWQTLKAIQQAAIGE